MGIVGHLLRLTALTRFSYGVIGREIISVRPSKRESFLVPLQQLWSSQRANWVSCVALNSMMTMNRREFNKFLERDKQCWHCGSTADDLIPHHRANRGSGGASKISKLNKPSNIIVMCGQANYLMEHDAEFADWARMFGWKISRYDDPALQVCYDLPRGVYCYLGDDFARVEVHNYGKREK